MFKSIALNALKIITGIFFVAAFLLFFPRLLTELFSLGRIFRATDVPERKTAIIFGAGLWRDGSPTPVLRDRVKTASNLYFSGKVDLLIMSGTSSGNYSEPKAMADYASSLGVPEDAIIQDFAGLRTYDTCYRARYTYGLREAILVTQSFHLPRALYLCNMLGIEADGVAADLQTYRRRSTLWWNLREVPATMVALWEIHVKQPKPSLTNSEPFFPSGAQ